MNKKEHCAINKILSDQIVSIMEDDGSRSLVKKAKAYYIALEVNKILESEKECRVKK